MVVRWVAASGSLPGGAENWSMCEESASFTLVSCAHRRVSTATMCLGFLFRASASRVIRFAMWHRFRRGGNQTLAPIVHPKGLLAEPGGATSFSSRQRLQGRVYHD